MSRSTIFAAEFGTDQGPACEACGATIYGYRRHGFYCDDGMPSQEFEAQCASCNRSELFEIRGDCAQDVSAVREYHSARVQYRASRKAGGS